MPEVPMITKEALGLWKFVVERSGGAVESPAWWQLRLVRQAEEAHTLQYLLDHFHEQERVRLAAEREGDQ